MSRSARGGGRRRGAPAQRRGARHGTVGVGRELWVARRPHAHRPAPCRPVGARSPSHASHARLRHVPFAAFVSFSTTTHGATVRYTTHGADPTEATLDSARRPDSHPTLRPLGARLQAGWPSSAIRRPFTDWLRRRRLPSRRRRQPLAPCGRSSRHGAARRHLPVHLDGTAAVNLTNMAAMSGPVGRPTERLPTPAAHPEGAQAFNANRVS